MKTGKLYHAFFLVIALIASLLLAMYAQTRIQDFENQTGLRMQVSADAAAAKLAIDIERVRGLAEVFAREHYGNLRPLFDVPADEARKKQIFDKTRSYFPEQFASTLTDLGGIPLFTSLTGKVGMMCQADLKAYAATGLPQHRAYVPTMHYGPSGMGFSRHFDVMVPVVHPQTLQAEGIFFVSLKATLLETTLRLHQLSGHRLLLMSAANPQDIQSEMDAAPLTQKQFPALSSAARDSIHAEKSVAGTGWTVLALPADGFIQSEIRKIQLDTAGIWLGFNLLLFFGFVFFKRESQRLLESDALNRALRTEVQARKTTEERLRDMTTFDQLTGLTNKQAMSEFLNHAIAAAQTNATPLAVLFFDLDRFKTLNDTLGHGYGDILLKEVAQRLKSRVQDVDLIARWGGDEFIVVMPQKDANAAGELAEKMVRSMQLPFQTGSHEIITSISIGIALFPDSGADMESLVKNAETAMYRAKHEGRNTFRFYNEEMSARFLDRLKLENDLRHALERNEYRVYFQPRVRLDDGSLIGAEALIRWQHPERGLVEPQVFLPLLEETGMIVEVGRYVLDQASRQIRAWHQARLHLAISVNLSARELAEPDLIEHISSVLLKTGIPPHLFELELTEGTLMAHTEQNLAKLAALKGLGIQIAVDDFGTGYSSLAYLKRFPIDTLKIDKSFIDGLPGNEDDESITTTIIRLGMGLALHIVAEGVEIPAQRGFLVSKGCHEGQGYLFGKPMPIDEFEAQPGFTSEMSGRP